ncbi:glycoside hydrolase family 2 TIM barrel-domain containing protein [Bacteroidota bacterium]
MKPIYWVIFVLIVGSSAWLIMKTGGNEARYEQTIDLNWRVMLADDPSFSKVDYDDSEWEIVTLPHDWMIRGEISDTNLSGTARGFYPGGTGWYRKHLILDEADSKEQFYLVFDGVYMNTDIWVNGTHVGAHEYGYIGFHFDISQFIRTDTVNIISVRTECSELPVDRWYSGAGIYRHVKLIATDHLHFPVQHSKIYSSVKQGDRIVSSHIALVNNERRQRRIKIKSDLIDPDGKIVASSIASRVIKGNSSVTIDDEHIVPDPLLWSAKEPNCYTLNSYLLHKNKVTDNVHTSFGIRDVQFSPDSGFILNNRKVWLKGVCIHHDGGALGAAVPEATWEYRLKLLKEMGVNALRLAHNPHAPELLDMCDRMGFYVINEMYDKWGIKWRNDSVVENTPQINEDDLRYFIRRDQNHPSVIAWSMGNETVEQLDDPELGVEWYRKLASITREIDTTRMITAGLHPYSPGDKPSSYILEEPLVSYNYRTDSFATWHQQYPELIWIASETKAYNENRRSDYGEISYLDNSWLDMEPFIAGQFIWSGIDYFGETIKWPYRSFYNGLISTDAEIKPYAYYTQSIYSETPMVKIVVVDQELVDSLNTAKTWQISWAGAPVVRHWNFTDKDSLNILVYTNCETVDVIINNKVKGRFDRKDFDDQVIQAELGYQPGKIIAMAYIETDTGLVVVSDSLVTSGLPTRILLEADKEEFIADGQDVVHIKTTVADTKGIKVARSTHLINYTINGPGAIKVIDNGNPTDSTPYNSTSKRLYKGSQLVIVQSTVEPGDLTINASSEGLRSATVKVTSEKRNKTSNWP